MRRETFGPSVPPISTRIKGTGQCHPSANLSGYFLITGQCLGDNNITRASLPGKITSRRFARNAFLIVPTPLSMNFRLVETGWDAEFGHAANGCEAKLRIITPFLQPDAVRSLLVKHPTKVSVITRFNLDELFRGVNSVQALRDLLNAGAEIKGIQHLHAKAYIFDDAQAIVTSANLTHAALVRNHELGFVVRDPAMVAECQRYFDGLWRRAGSVLTLAELRSMEAELKTARAKGINIASTGLGDRGTNLGYPPAASLMPSGFALGREAYVKFSGIGSGRVPLSVPTLDEVKGSGMHWACCYPIGKAPRQPQADDTMFLARLTSTPHGNDITIYGRAVVTRAHDNARDVANAAEKEVRSWKKDWPNYIRVHSPEFVAGTLANGVQLSQLVNTFAEFSYASTERRALKGETRIKPRHSVRQQASVHLSQRAKVWLNGQLEAAFASHGTLAEASFIDLP